MNVIMAKIERYCKQNNKKERNKEKPSRERATNQQVTDRRNSNRWRYIRFQTPCSRLLTKRNESEIDSFCALTENKSGNHSVYQFAYIYLCEY